MKSLLSDMDVARDFLASLMPGHLLCLLDMSTLKPEHSSFITQELQEVFADAVFSVRLQQSEAVGAESLSASCWSTSYADEQTAFQMLLYLAQGYREQLKPTTLKAYHPVIVLPRKGKLGI
ncbi:MAG: Rpn family recombination-promoting nuclease/putative transposase [Haliscomenobacter sp.]|nr:Rpn family recombination-promoting nuclease/putative transposase [Haliscomenobacter sp.]